MLFIVLDWKELKNVILAGDLCAEITTAEYQELGKACVCSLDWVRPSFLSKQNHVVLHFILRLKNKTKRKKIAVAVKPFASQMIIFFFDGCCWSQLTKVQGCGSAGEDKA